MSQQRLIVGLGNPGKDYEHTRHNLGFQVVQSLIKKYKLRFVKSSAVHGEMAEGICEGHSCCFLLPHTFMNNSGVAVNEAVIKKGIELEHLLVVCDDCHLDLGQLRLKRRGSDGGHHGLSSIIQHLGSDGFARLRAGIGSPAGKEDYTDYVLGTFTSHEKKGLKDFIEKAADCCLMWLTKGAASAMNLYNKRKVDE